MSGKKKVDSYIKRVSIPKHKKEIYDLLEEMADKKNRNKYNMTMSEYICNLIEQDMNKPENSDFVDSLEARPNDDEILKQLSELNAKMDSILNSETIFEIKESLKETKKDVKSLGFDLDQ